MLGRDTGRCEAVTKPDHVAAACAYAAMPARLTLERGPWPAACHVKAGVAVDGARRDI